MLKDGFGLEKLEAERRQPKSNKKKTLKMCTNCNAFVDSNYFFNHKKKCNAIEKDSSQAPVSTSGLASDMLTTYKQYDEEFADMLNRFLRNEKGNECRQNEMIIKFGEYLYKKGRQQKGKQVETRKNVMQCMRLLAGLYLKFKEVAASKGVLNLTINDMFHRSNFPFLEENIELLSYTEKRDLKSGTKLFIGTVLKRSIKIFKGLHLINKNDSDAEELDKFSAVLNLRWNAIFAEAECDVVRSRQDALRRPENLPLDADVGKVRRYVISETEKITSKESEKILATDFIRLRNLTLTRITFFNARRGGEPSRILLSEWQNALDDKWMNLNKIKTLPEAEQKKLLENKILYQGGKGGGRLVPVIILKDLVPALKLLSDPLVRSRSGINSANPFLFPSSQGSMDHALGYNCILKITTEAGVSKNLTATQIRHRASTLFSELEIPQEERESFYNHMGHSADINRHIYQCPASMQEIRVGEFLSHIDEDAPSTSNFLGKLYLFNVNFLLLVRHTQT